MVEPIREYEMTEMLKKLHYWLAYVAPWPLYKLARLVDRALAVLER